MWTRPCIIMIVLLQFHCGFSLLSPFQCYMLSILFTMTCTVALLKIDVIISPLRILVLNLLFKKYLPPCYRYFVVLMSLLLLLLVFFARCVIIFVRFSILCSLLSIVVACLLVVAGYISYTVFASWPPLDIVHCLEFVSIDVSFWSLVSHVPVLLFPVSSYFFCSTPLLFLSSSLDTVDLRYPLRCPLFSPTLWHFFVLERIIVLVVLDLQLETLRDCHGTFLFAYSLVRRFAPTFVLFHPMPDNIMILLKHLIDTQ